MLRSFDYAAAAATNERLELRPQDPDAVQRAAAEWQRLAAMNFLQGYRDSIGDAPSHPAAEEAERLLDLFLLEKVLYEIGYEAANRPAWIGIPLGGLLRLLGKAS